MVASKHVGRFVWEVWSVAPNGFRRRCRGVFEYADWQFAEKLSERLRERNHEDVETRLAHREKGE
jgi:hypothetical protein